MKVLTPFGSTIIYEFRGFSEHGDYVLVSTCGRYSCVVPKSRVV